MPISNPIAPPIVVPGTGTGGSVAYAAAAPIAWTDLDLSGIIGARRCVVLLRVTNDSVGTSIDFKVRRNGDAVDMFQGGANGVSLLSSGGVRTYLVVDTDDSGICEMLSSSAQDIQIHVLHWWGEAV